MKQHIIIGNFGNHSLAVMQALVERGLSELHFIYVETGWAAASWPERVHACSTYARSQGVVVHALSAKANFSEMVIDRKQFPSPKFQWCAGFLKGLAILNHLDELDPACEALITSGKRQLDSRRYTNLQEFEYDDELYQGRTLWHPLWQTNDIDFGNLIKRAGFSLLPHQSLECSPCIHTKIEDLVRIDQQSVARLKELEERVGQTMYPKPIQSLTTLSEAPESQEGINLQLFDLGCGAPWGCGE